MKSKKGTSKSKSAAGGKARASTKKPMKAMVKPQKMPTKLRRPQKTKAPKSKGNLPARGQGAIRSTGKSNLNPKAVPMATLNAGEVDPKTPRPTGVKRSGFSNAVNMQKAMLSAQKGYKSMAGEMLKKKMHAGGARLRREPAPQHITASSHNIPR